MLAGCSNGEPGDARPVASTGSPTSESARPTTSKPARPKEIKLDGIDPCATFTAAQRTELKIDETSTKPLDVLRNDKPAPTCRNRANGKTLFSYNVVLVADGGVEHWEGGSNLDVHPKSVAGFAAYQLTLTGTSEGYCSYSVDVADGQQLYVQFIPVGDGFTQDQMCQNAAKGAELALATLQTLK
ncbi:DUF3558 domain-containing protein [Saccharothrix isguenensis]